MRVLLALVAGVVALIALRRRPSVCILRISRVVADLERAEAFYRDGLGFRRVSGGPGDPALAALLGLPGAVMEEAVMRLGEQEVTLVRFDPPGPPYPPDSRSDDLWFQHVAIVVADMDLAYRTLCEQSPDAISTGGPQRLPPRNGRVVAYKFRDPDGHPLELIHFPLGQGNNIWQTRAGDGPFLGIDHSALVIAATPRSLRFYRRLGFRVADRSLNYGPDQARLDGLAGATARITGLRLGDTVPGLELLAYKPPGRPAPRTPTDAIATDWVTLLVPRLGGGSPLASAARASLRRDPDGHLMLLVNRH